MGSDISVHHGQVSGFRPLTPETVVSQIAHLAEHTPGPMVLAIDGAPAAGPHLVAEQVVSGLRSRPVLHVRDDGYWHPAGRRLESGRTNPDAWLADWLDASSLQREVLDALHEHGRALRAIRDPATDRSVRESAHELGPHGVVIVSGSALLGRTLAFDRSVHLHLSTPALARRTPADQAWTLPAIERYERESGPDEHANLVIRWDDPQHPAALVKPFED